MVYDVCFLLLQSIAHDARTLNLARTLVKNGKSVLLLGIGTADDCAHLALEGLIFIPILPPTPLSKLFLRWMKFYVFLFFKRNEFCSRIYCAEDVFTLPMAVMLASKFNSKVIYDSREIFSALASNHSRPLRQKIITLIEKKYVKNVTRMFTSGELDSEYLSTYLSIPTPVVIMNVPPFSTPNHSNLLRDKYSIPKNSRILIYQGWIAEGRGIIEVVKALQHLPEMVLCLVGDGEFQTVVLERARQEHVENRVIFCGKVPYDHLPLLTASADAGICFIEPISLSYSFALPNKLFEYCMAGIPTLVSDLPAMRRVLEEFPIGILVDPKATSILIAKSIRELFDEQFQLKFHEIQTTAARNYCWENQEHKVLDIFTS
ncbi:MAG: glycosyltransferase [Ignavibacteria bacterium]|nr:glycosyltransferase [Ignavibacteria bacterium]